MSSRWPPTCCATAAGAKRCARPTVSACWRARAALREAPERTRSIFLLYRVEQMKKRDIAETYGISTSAVDKHLMKAMAHLWKRLGNAS